MLVKRLKKRNPVLPYNGTYLFATKNRTLTSFEPQIYCLLNRLIFSKPHAHLAYF